MRDSPKKKKIDKETADYEKMIMQGRLIEKQAAKGEWYEDYGWKSLLGNANWAIFYAILGARDAGKSYSVTKYFVKKWKEKGIPFTWLRLTEAGTKKLLANNAEKLIDPDIRRKYNLDLKTKGTNVYDHGKLMARVLALSTFYSDKGSALFDKDFLTNNKGFYYHIALDEMQRESGEKNTFDIGYSFINQLENLVRDTKDRMKIFLIGNTLEEASDILTMFNFIPEQFGRYKIKKKRCVIDYMPPSEGYRRRREGSIADLLAKNESNFTNELRLDHSLVTKKRLLRPTQIIVFDKNTKFTIWDSKVVAEYNNENCKSQIAMRPYQDLLFNTELRDSVILLFDNQALLYKNLITLKKFKKELKFIKPRKG